jgi:hypothetical protein
MAKCEGKAGKFPVKGFVILSNEESEEDRQIVKTTD